MRIFVCSLVVLALAAGLPLGQAFGDAPLPLAETAFRSSGAAFSYALVSAWGAFVQTRARPGQDLLLAGAIARALGLTAPIREERGSSYVRVASQEGGTFLVVETVQVSPTVSETVYSVDRRSNTFPREEDVAGLTEPLQALGLHPRVSVNLVGASPGDLRRSGRRLFRKIFGGEGTGIATGITQGAYWSVAGDVPDGGPAVLVAGRPVNLQVALSYDRATERTQVTVGTPLISITY